MSCASPSSTRPAAATGVSSSSKTIVNRTSDLTPDQDAPSATEKGDGDDQKSLPVEGPLQLVSEPGEGSISSPHPRWEPIDDLFEAIQNAQLDKMDKILKKDPYLLNAENHPEDKMTAQEFLDSNKLGNLLTQDILCRQQHKEPEMHVKWFGSQRPLHVACVFGNIEPVKMLLNWETPRIDINLTNASKETPLGIACRAAHLPVAKLLLEKSMTLEDSRKIQVALQDDLGHTPIHYLAGQGIYPTWPEDRKPTDDDLKLVVSLMLEASNDGDNPKEKEFGRFCMEVAASQGSTSLMEILLDIAGGSKDLQDEDGWTPLHFGAAVGQADIVDMLLKRRADPKIKTKIPGPYSATELALYYGELAIAAHIQEYLHQRKFEESHDKGLHLQAWTWHGKPKQQDQVTSECFVKDLIKSESVETIRQQLSTDQTVWCHLPANKWDWVKSLCNAARSKDPDRRAITAVLQETLSSITQPPHHEHQCFKATSRRLQDDAITKAGAPGSKSQAASRRNSLADFLNTVTVLPLIDIDLLDQRELQNQKLPKSLPKERSDHIGSMQQLYHSNRSELHRSWTLDHYFYRNIEKKRLKTLDNEQVLSRYINRRTPDGSSRQEPERTNTKNYIKQIIGFVRSCAKPLGRAYRKAKAVTDIDVEHQPTSDQHQQGEFASSDTERYGSEPNNPNKVVQDSFSIPILVVSQLWLIRMGNLLVTAFPQRWDSATKDNFSKQTLRSLVKPNTGAAVDPKVLIHQIVQKSMEYQPSIKVGDDTLTYLEIFLEEILRIEQQVEDCYVEFKNSLGKSEVNFTKLSNNATQCLLHINDVLHEVGMVKQVLERRSIVWEMMHGMPTKAREKPQSNPKCHWIEDGELCNTIEVRDNSFAGIDRIEGDAEIVQTKIKDFMGLLYGQAGTENSLKSSEQARYLAIFTWLTLIFSPLSFVMSVMALQIKSFTPSLWTEWQVAGASIASVAVTFAICLVAYLLLRRDDRHKALEGRKRSQL